MLAISFQILLPYNIFENIFNSTTASAEPNVTTPKLNVNTIYKKQMDNLGWITVNNSGIFQNVNPDMWANTNLDAYSGIIKVNEEYTYVVSEQVIEPEVTTAPETTTQPDETTAPAETTATEVTTEPESSTEVEKITATIDFSEITKDSPVWADVNEYADDNPGGWTVDNNGTKRIDFKNKISSEKSYSSELVTDDNYSDLEKDSQIGYKICYDSTLQGYYREYHVYTADQLAWLIYVYGGSIKDVGYTDDTFNKGLQITDEDLNKVEETSTTTKKAVNKLGIKLESNLDLGGANNQHWRGFRNPQVLLDIDGQGYTIYNGYFTAEYFSSAVLSKSSFDRNAVYNAFLYQDQKFSVRNVTFSNMLITSHGGMFGHGVYRASFNNVNWVNCISSANRSSSTIVLGNSYLTTYFKDCTISNCYVKGGGHSALFASFNAGGAVSRDDANNYNTYIDDKALKLNGGSENRPNQYVYYTEIPDSLEEIEMVWQESFVKRDENGNLVVTDSSNKQAQFYTSPPSIYENCATVDSYVYEAGEHSGTFVSCMQGNIIFKNCFTNCVIYGANRIGTFIGMCIGSSNGFYYPLDGKRQYLNSLFDGCFSSGSVEGTNIIGGFIGSVYYSDNRSLQVDHRGFCAFTNCYSTSAVGMQYAGNHIGGFVGAICGNIGNGNVPDNEKHHIFKNCYAAGEVGSMLSNVSTDESNQETLGGFVGTISWDRPEATFKNCYYDKQTTAMRERAIGIAQNDSYGTNINQKGSQLCTDESYVATGKIMGVYTMPSSIKSVQGLACDNGTTKLSADMGDKDVWHYEYEYYPIIKAFLNYEVPTGETNTVINDMHKQRADLFYNYAMASTATVLLDHYDQVLTDEGELVSSVTDGDITKIYDTVRDITSKFEFTTDETNNVAWKLNNTRNEADGFIDTIDSIGDGFDIKTTVGNDTISVNHNPKVISIVKDTTIANDIRYKCVEFAPGRQWVTVTAKKENTKIAGDRDLRLLPTAYLSAGGTMEINVQQKDDGTTNTVTYKGEADINLSKFNHSVGVAYAISDKYRMINAIGQDKTVAEYEIDSNNTDAFALYSGYTITDKGSSAVGLNTDNKMYDQKFEVTDKVGLWENDSSSGMTMVKVYKTTPGTETTTTADGATVKTFTLEKGDQVTGDDLKKWSGDELFETDDVGYYYLEYYWRLNDGRYLSDIKLVKVSSTSYNVEMVTGILDEEHSVLESATTDGFRSSIDQYVTTDTSDTAAIKFPSKESDFLADNAKDYYNGSSYSYNQAAEFDGENYYMKSYMISTSGTSSRVYWHRTTDYRLTTLILEVYDGTAWQEMTRIDGNNPKFDFDDAKYSYNFTSLSVEQNEETKLFIITENAGTEMNFEVKSSGADTTGIQNYIDFSLESTDGEGTTYTENSNNIRVTALFRQTTAEVSTEKNVYLLPSDYTLDTDAITSLAERDSAYEVGNSDIDADDNNKRKAVLSGDILTYRLKATNTGFFDSDVADFYDTIPQGCTYVDGSVKIYKQKKDPSSGTPVFEKLTDVTTEQGYVAEYDGSDQSLHWQIPSVELYCDYYLEFKAKVNTLDAKDLKNEITNDAYWSYISLSGDLLSDKSMVNITDIKSYKAAVVFQLELEETQSASDTGKSEYFINFKPNTENNTDQIDNMNLEIELPDGVTLTESDIKLYDYDGKTEVTTTGHTIVVSADKSNVITITKLQNPTNGYSVKFTIDTLKVDENNPRQEVIARATYSSNGATKGNTIKQTVALTNEVTTDQTHLYFDIKKTITNEDPAQTFLFKVEYYPLSATEPSETFYTQVRCTDENNGSYTGDRIVQVDKRGNYVITEVSDWSNTDYDFSNVSANDAKIVDIAGLESNTAITSKDKSVTISLPRSQYKSLAFPTSYGLLASYPTAEFKNKESEYAYLSGQAYAENVFKTKTAS